MIVADTGAIIALIDAGDRHHAEMVRLFEETGSEWVLPWAILPEVDYLAATHIGAAARSAFHADLADETFSVEWGRPEDLVRSRLLCTRYDDLGLGLVDSVVAAVAERLKADAIVTVDLRDFGAVKLKTNPKLYPRDWT